MQLVTLDSTDVPDMLELARITQPGPFGAATLGLGTYLGFRGGGELVAMAGQRFHPPGWRELSAICTHPDYRGRGLSRRLIRALLAATHASAEHTFLHVLESNTAALGLYESMGFTCRATVTFTGLHRPPG